MTLLDFPEVDPADELDESEFCECQLDPIIEEDDWGVCFSCGKPLE